MRRKRVIRTWDLTKYYGKVTGIEALYIEVVEGETFGLLGLSGSGKSTAIQLFLGLIWSSRGRAEVLGLDTRRESYQIRQQSGCVPGSFNFYGEATGREFLDLCAKARGDHTGRRRELLERLDVDPGRKFGTISRSERQKLSFVQALMHDPVLLFLDNPSAGLDSPSQETISQLLAEEKNRGKTLLLSTDSPTEVTRLCDRVGIVQKGYLKHVQDMAEIKKELGRRIRVTFREDVDLEDIITEDLSVIHHQGREWILAVRGNMGGVIRRMGQSH